MMINLGATSARLLFWLLMCPKCLFETDIKLIGHQMVTYGQKIICDCPNCKERIVKTVGVDLGIMDDESVISLPVGKLSPPGQGTP